MKPPFKDLNWTLSRNLKSSWFGLLAFKEKGYFPLKTRFNVVIYHLVRSLSFSLAAPLLSYLASIQKDLKLYPN